MKRLVIIPILLIAGMLQCYSQTDTTRGVAFVQGLTWQEVLQKAKQENKYVFVDCFTTWCGPCKIMDQKVYPDDAVGKFMNENFISVRVQMDTTAADSREVKSWYAIGHAFLEQYHIYSYPSYLFFSTEGKAVHKDLGGKESEDFLTMARAAMNPNGQYYTLLYNFRHRGMDYALMPVLANEAAQLGQDSVLQKVVISYIREYFESLSLDQLWTKEHIEFIHRYSLLLDYDVRVFRLYYRDRAKIDSIMNFSKYAENDINNVIYSSEVGPLVEKAIEMDSKLDWYRLKQNLEKRYDEVYAENNVLHAQVEYYKSKKEWPKYVKYFIQQQEAAGVESWETSKLNSAFLNNDAYEIFQYSRNRRELKKALLWVNRAISMIQALDPEVMDTKANLLYKLGRRSEALALEEQSYKLSHGNGEIRTNYEKMRSGQPTWSAEYR
jgi:thiol-disulfide isomerase/thioredoxin